MSTLCRLAGQRLSCYQKAVKPLNFLQTARHVTLKSVPQPKVDENYDLHNMQLHRPQSPHLSIYAVELHSTVSITHRFTGVAVTVYSVALGTSALVLPNKLPYYLEALQAAHISPTLLLAAKFVLAFPFTYHFFNGIRHLIWDTGRFLTMPGVYTTAYVMLACTFLTTLGLLCL
ncbi:hypothetical protein FQA39_LY07434 [Lamprigera yunnana]|nr:hypothetical protein FQA39_LY07434 [Lamprigera yunnana]